MHKDVIQMGGGVMFVVMNVPSLKETRSQLIIYLW